MSLELDCSWKQMTCIAVRNLPGPPARVKLLLESATFFYQTEHSLTCNPTWRNLEIPKDVFPVSLKVYSNEECLLETFVDSKKMHFVCESLQCLESFDFPVCFIEFSEEGFFTTEEFSENFTHLARNCSFQIKLLATQEATSRRVNFSKIQNKYKRILEVRKQLAQNFSEIKVLKDQLRNVLQDKKSFFPLKKKTSELQEHVSGLNSASNNKTELVKGSKSLVKEIKGQQEVATQLLNAHKRKYSERAKTAKKDREHLSLKERLTHSRRIKLWHELYGVFKTSNILTGLKEINDSINFYQKDEQVSSSLGYLGLIVQVLADYCRIELRHEFKFQGSRSYVCVGGKNLPLYRVGKNIEADKTTSAVKALFENIQQLPSHYIAVLLP